MMIDVKNAGLAVDGQVLLDDVSLAVDKGACHVLLGENGSGKTTLLDCIRGARRLTSGAIRVLGEDAAALPWSLRRRFNSVLAPSAFPFNLRVKEICRLYSSIYGVSRYPLQQLAELFCLTDIMDKKWSVLSSGQKQRLSLGLSQLGNPELILLDEPFTNLDDESSLVTKHCLQKCKSDGITLVIATHDTRYIDDLIDRTSVMTKGSIKYC